MEFLFEIFGELLLQVLTETLAEAGLHSFAEPFQRQPRPWLAALGYLLFGAVLGGLSVWIFPNHFIASNGLRIANVVLVPIVAGLCMAAIGAWRARRGQAVLRIDQFSYGYLFALAFGLMRFWFAQ